MNISPINGYETKHSQSEKLREDVEKFLNGREVKVIPVAFKPKKTREECKPFRPEVNWKYKPNKNKAKSAYVIEQSALLVEYVAKTPAYKRWARLLSKSDYVVAVNDLRRVANGDHAIADKREWSIVRDAINSIISEIEREDVV